MEHRPQNFKAWIKAAAVVSISSIGFMSVAQRGVQPHEYIQYFEYWTVRSNTKSRDLDARGDHETASE